MRADRSATASWLLVALGGLLALTPANAQRGIAIDQPPLFDANVCTLGSPACSGFLLRAAHTNRIRPMYVYAEGIVSFGAPLSASASLAGGPSTFGDVAWFAPGFGTTRYQARVSFTDNGLGPQPLVGFFAPGVPITEEIFDDPATEEDESRPATLPVMQLQMFRSSDKYPDFNPYSFAGDPDWEDLTIGFGYNGSFSPDKGALIGFSAQGASQSASNNKGLSVPKSNFLVTLPGMEFEPEVVDESGEVIVPERFFYPTAVADFRIIRDKVDVPEPATWAMMILGFGLLGGAARKRSRLVRNVC
jgi:hypothetical protein